jgi:putative ABC transport system permease protein
MHGWGLVLTLSFALAIFASLVTLLVICANLANLQLARTAARSREFGIRLSLGCPRSRLTRQLIIEARRARDASNVVSSLASVLC